MKANFGEPVGEWLSRVRSTCDRGRVWMMLLVLFVMAANSVATQTVATESGPSRQIPRLVALLIAVVVIWSARVKVDRLVIALVLAAVGGALLRHNPDQLSYIFVVVMAVALTTLSPRSAASLAAIGCGVALALVFVFLAFGWSSDYVIELRERRTFGVASIGFVYNLVFGALAMFGVWSARLRLPVRLGGLVVTLGLATWFFFETDARAGYLSYLAFSVLLFVPAIIWRNRVWQFCVAVLPMLFLVGAWILAGLSDNERAVSIFSNRPIYFNLLLEDLSLRDLVLSRSVKALDQSNIVDNSYLHLLVGGGIVVAGLFLALHFKAIPALVRNGHYADVAIIFSLALYFNMESILVRPDLVFIIYYWHLLVRGWRLSAAPQDAQTRITSERISA